MAIGQFNFQNRFRLLRGIVRSSSSLFRILVDSKPQHAWNTPHRGHADGPVHWGSPGLSNNNGTLLADFTVQPLVTLSR